MDEEVVKKEAKTKREGEDLEYEKSDKEQMEDEVVERETKIERRGDEDLE